MISLLLIYEVLTSQREWGTVQNERVAIDTTKKNIQSKIIIFYLYLFLIYKFNICYYIIKRVVNCINFSRGKQLFSIHEIAK